MSNAYEFYYAAEVTRDQVRQPTACVSVTLALHHAAKRRQFLITTHNMRQVK